MDKRPFRIFELCTERIETLEDMKKIFKMLHLRINTDNPHYEELKYYFSTEVIPPGYIKLYEKVGDEIYTMPYEEMVEKGLKLLQEEEID